MPKIWSYGFINLDVVTQTVSHWPDVSGLVSADSIQFMPGGVALNPAVTIGKLGGQPVGLIGYVGDDQAADIIQQTLAASGVDASYVVVVRGQSTGICIVCVHPDGERSFIMTWGANGQLGPNGLNINHLAAGDILHIGGTANMQTPTSVLQQIQARGVMISVDATVDSSGQGWHRFMPLFPYIGVFTANVSEAVQLTGLADPVLAAQKIASEGPQIVAIKLGADGAFVHTPEWQGHIPSFDVSAIDTTGAGDAFAGSLLYGIMREWPVQQAVTFANSVGALCATSAGATDGVCSYAETVAFIRLQGRGGQWDWDEVIGTGDSVNHK